MLPLTCLILGAENSSDQCKVHSNFGKKYSVERPSKERKYENPINHRKKGLNFMVQNSVYHILKEHIDRKMSTKVYSNGYCEVENVEISVFSCRNLL